VRRVAVKSDHSSVRCYVARRQEGEFHQKFAYAFRDTGYIGTKPQVTLVEFDDAPFSLLGEIG